MCEVEYNWSQFFVVCNEGKWITLRPWWIRRMADWIHDSGPHQNSTIRVSTSNTAARTDNSSLLYFFTFYIHFSRIHHFVICFSVSTSWQLSKLHFACLLISFSFFEFCSFFFFIVWWLVELSLFLVCVKASQLGVYKLTRVPFTITLQFRAVTIDWTDAQKYWKC